MLGMWVGRKTGKNNNRAGCDDGIRRKIKNNDASSKSTNDEAAQHKLSAHWII